MCSGADWTQDDDFMHTLLKKSCLVNLRICLNVLSYLSV